MAADDDEDLFSRFYTYEETMTAHADRVKPETKPAHWPDDTEVDYKNKWVWWLPQDWGQGMKVTSGGKPLKCFVAPSGKRFFHRNDISKYLKSSGLPDLPTKEPVDDGAGKSVHDGVPKWPDWDLPRDWKLAFRKVGSSNFKVYIIPGNYDQFLYHKSEVEEFLAGTRKTGFQISLSVRTKVQEPTIQEGADDGVKKKRKKSDKRCFELCLPPGAKTSCPPEPEWVAPMTMEFVPQALIHYRSLLVKRGFDNNVKLIAVHSMDEKQIFARRICGVYFQMPEKVNGRSVYQRLQHSSKCVAGICCDRVYIIQSEGGSTWQFTNSLAEGCPIYAYCQAEEQSSGVAVEDAPGPWYLRSNLWGRAIFVPDAGMAILADVPKK